MLVSGSFCTTLGLIFLVLKLTDTIAWSWWWVLLPFYGPALLAFVCLLVVFLFGWHKIT
jgi:hypothetical protein